MPQELNYNPFDFNKIPFFDKIHGKGANNCYAKWSDGK